MRRENSQCRCVYLVDGGGGVFKVGKAADAKRRVADLQVGSPVHLSLSHVIHTPHATVVESHFHRLFKGVHSHGEWFRLTAEQVETFVQFTPADCDRVAAESAGRSLKAESRALAEGLVRLREERGMSQIELAAKAGISRQYLSLIEQQKSNPYFEDVCKLADVFGVSTETFANNPFTPAE